MIGGALARPVETMPTLFARDGIFDRLPYLLPNLFSACCVFLGVIIGVLFLEETHVEKKRCRDRGVELGNYLLSRIASVRASKAKVPEEERLLGETDEPLPGYCADDTAFSSVVAAQAASNLREAQDVEAFAQLRRSRTERREMKTWSRTIILVMVTFGILAL